ncbi:MAG: hypothetical protein J4F29_21100, partial [Candidatus Latescibacteria bacterium]|nr:hypothetical protein [Candidatus Latescibacterota bacterium]
KRDVLKCEEYSHRFIAPAHSMPFSQYREGGIFLSRMLSVKSRYESERYKRLSRTVGNQFDFEPTADSFGKFLQRMNRWRMIAIRRL